MLSAALPVLENVTACAAALTPTVWAPKLRLPGLIAAAGCKMPVPLSITICGEPDAESANVSDAVRAPLAVGEKTTDTLQLELTPKLPEHVEPMEKVARIRAIHLNVCDRQGRRAGVGQRDGLGRADSGDGNVAEVQAGHGQ